MADPTLAPLTGSSNPVALLGEIARALFTSDQPESVVAAIFTLVAAHLDLDVFVSYLAGPDQGGLRLAASKGLTEAQLASLRALNETVCPTRAASGEPVVVERAQASSDPSTLTIRALGIRAYACHPLVAAEGELVGTVAFGSRRRETFAKADLQLMEVVAHQVAVAIQRARAVSRLERELRERQRAEEAVREREAELRRERRFFRTIIDSVPSLITVRDRSGRFLLANEAAARFHGMTVETLEGRESRDVPTIVREMLELDREALETGRETTVEAELRAADGQRRFLITSRTPLENADGVRDRVLSSSADVTWLKRAQHALRESEDRLRLAIDSTELGTFDFDPQAGRLILSGHARRHFGLSPDADLNYATFLRGLHPRDRERVHRIVQLALRGEQGGDYATEYRTIGIEDGRERWLSARGRVFFDRAGRPVRFVGVTLDITERHRAEEELRVEITERKRAEAALREADQRKDQFLAVLSHELRNPLAPIRYALPLLQQDDLGHVAQRAITVINRQVDHLTRLIDDLLDVSRITRGKIELRREHVTLASVLNSAIEAASPLIAAARHQLDVIIEEEPVWLDVDAARIAQVTTNLLNNSAKYTPRGGRIRLEARREEGRAVISVRDNGMGIPAEALPTIFEMFRQVNRPDAAQGGLGIGLALVKQLVDMHGGCISVSSAGPGQGAEFVVRLPLSEEASGAAAPAKRSSPDCGRRLKVLVVDDNVDLVEMLAMLVSAQGHEVRKALDGRSALSAALSYRPDLVLLDLGLPIMGGLEVARELRRHPEMGRVRLVAMTGWGQPEDRRQAREAGFDEHLTKPADPEQLGRVLAETAAG